MPVFMDGPAAGHKFFDEATDDHAPPGFDPSQPPPPGAGPPPPGFGPPPGAEAGAPAEGEDEEALFAKLMASINSLRALPSVKEQNKLALEKAATLIQQIKADEEKEMEGAMQGKLSPGLLARANRPQGGPPV